MLNPGNPPSGYVGARGSDPLGAVERSTTRQPRPNGTSALARAPSSGAPGYGRTMSLRDEAGVHLGSGTTETGIEWELRLADLRGRPHTFLRSGNSGSGGSYDGNPTQPLGTYGIGYVGQAERQEAAVHGEVARHYERVALELDDGSLFPAQYLDQAGALPVNFYVAIGPPRPPVRIWASDRRNHHGAFVDTTEASRGFFFPGRARPSGYVID